MARRDENTGFVCLNCYKTIEALTNGSYRNHCPFCLYSLHVDGKPGDRQSFCRALMEPIGLVFKSKKGWQIIHRCTACRHQSVNKIAENTIQPDVYDSLLFLGIIPNT